MMQRWVYLLLAFSVACGQPIPTAEDFDPADVGAPLDVVTADADATTDIQGSGDAADTSDTATLDADVVQPTDVTVLVDVGSDTDVSVPDDVPVDVDVAVPVDAQPDADAAAPVDVELDADALTLDADAALDAGLDADDTQDTVAPDTGVDLCGGGKACASLPCATNTCDPATGECVATPLANGSPCLVGGGPCMACESNACVPNDLGSCDDGNACTANDACAAGSCTGAKVNCDDGNACTTEACEALTGCVYTDVLDGTACDDGKTCTLNDACTGKKCQGDASKCKEICFSDADCPGSACDNVTHICYACTSDAGCNSGETCVNHVCGTTPSCMTPGATCPDAAKPFCDPSTAICVACVANTDCPSVPPLPGVCIGNACRTQDICTNSFLPCPLGKKCDILSGLTLPVAAGVCGDCGSDGDCPSDQYCDYGVCVPDICIPGDSACKGDNPLVCSESGGGYEVGGCDDGNVCTSDGCNATGCTHVPAASSGMVVPCVVDACNTGFCDASGACSGPTPINCDDSVACNIDSCEPSAGCVHASKLFTKSFGGTDTEDLRRVVPQADGSVVVAGNKHFPGADANQYWVAELGATGAVSWEVAAGGIGDQHLMDFAAVPGDMAGFALVMYGDMVGDGSEDAALVRLDAKGAETWRKVLPHPGKNDELHALVVLSDGFLVAGRTDVGNVPVGWAIRTDVTGNILWEQTYAGIGLSNVTGVAVDSSGILFVGNNAWPGVAASAATAVRTDLTGAVVWTKALSGWSDAAAVTTTADGFVIAGTALGTGTPGTFVPLLRATRILRSNGSFVWEVTSPGAEGSHEVFASASVVGGTVIGGSVTGNDGLTRAQVQFISDKGALGWSRVVDGYLTSRFLGVTTTANGVLTAGLVTVVGGVNPDGLVATYDHFGNASCGLSGYCYSASNTLCNDTNPCTADVCTLSGACQFTPIGDGVACDDGQVCTTQEVCSSGSCSGGTLNLYCKEPCTADSQCASSSCDLATSTCNECTVSAECSTGICVNGKCFVQLDCTIQDCVVGTCVGGKCQACSTNADCPGSSCVDGRCSANVSGCTTSASCFGNQMCDTFKGQCVECVTDGDCGKDRYCSSKGHCEHQVCTSTVCTASASLACNTNGSGYTLTSCDDGNACTTDICDPIGGCVHEAIAAGGSCADGTGCSTSVCDGAGSCISATKVCPKDGVCDPGTGQCVGGVAATWGKCAWSDQTCVNTCAQTKCVGMNAACGTSPGCVGLANCMSECQTSGQMPPVTVPISKQEFGESATAYCTRQCFANAGPTAAWILLDGQYCAIGRCVDCAADGGAIATECQQDCGIANFCGGVNAMCKGNFECLGILTCALSCSTTTCQAACENGTSTFARKLYKATADCMQANASGVCVKGP